MSVETESRSPELEVSLACLQQCCFYVSQKCRTPKGYFQERYGRTRNFCWRLHWQWHKNYWLSEARLLETGALSVSKKCGRESLGRRQKSSSLWFTWSLSLVVSIRGSFLGRLLFSLFISCSVFFLCFWRWEINCVLITDIFRVLVVGMTEESWLVHIKNQNQNTRTLSHKNKGWNYRSKQV